MTPHVVDLRVITVMEMVTKRHLAVVGGVTTQRTQTTQVRVTQGVDVVALKVHPTTTKEKYYE